MKTTHLTKLSLTVLLSGLTIYFSGGQSLTALNPIKTNDKAKEVMQENEFERNKIGQTDNIHCNPLLLNGQSLDYGHFTLKSTGELALIKGEPGSSKASKIPFVVRLRRNGNIVETKNMDFLNKELYKIEISKVLAFGLPGDQLIINPANKVDWKAKRILKLVL